MSSYEEKNLYERIMLRHSDMVSERDPYDPDCDKIIDLFRPDLMNFKDKIEGKHKGILGAKIHEGTGPWAMRLMSDGLQGNVVSSSINWLNYQVGNQAYKGNDAMNKWLQDFKEAMMSSYSDENSNFYAAMGPFTRHGITVGSPVIIPELDTDSGMIIDLVPHPSTRYLMQNRFGISDVLHLETEWTIRNAVRTFGKEKFSNSVQHKYKQGHNDKVRIIQAFYFYLDRIFNDLPKVPTKVTEDGKESTYQNFTPRWPWISIYCEKDKASDSAEEKTPLRIEGYWSKPFSAWHYEKDQTEVYSRTPAWFSYYDTSSANQMRKSIMMAGQKSVESAWWVHEYLKGVFKGYPRGVNWYTTAMAQYKPEQLYEKINYPFGFEIEDRFADSVKRHFYTPMWEMLSVWSREQKAPPTATQIINMMGEKAVLLGPRIGPFLRTLHEIDARHIDIENRRGNLPEPPDEVIEILQDSNGKVRPEFVGPLYQAQKQYLSTRGVEAALASIMPVIEIDPMARHKIKADKLVEFLLEEAKFPQELINDDDEYQDILNAIAQQQMQQQAMEMGTNLAKAIPSVSKDVEPNSPLAGLIEGTAA